MWLLNIGLLGGAFLPVYTKGISDSKTNQYKANRVEQDCAVWDFSIVYGAEDIMRSRLCSYKLNDRFFF